MNYRFAILGFIILNIPVNGFVLHDGRWNLSRPSNNKQSISNNQLQSSSCSKYKYNNIGGTLIILNNRRKWDDEIEENSLRRAQSNRSSGGGSGIGETAAGAVLGGLLLGPFGRYSNNEFTSFLF